MEKHLPDASEPIAVKAEVMGHRELVDLAARHVNTGDSGQYTTRQALEQKQQATRTEQPRQTPGGSVRRGTVATIEGADRSTRRTPTGGACGSDSPLARWPILERTEY